ncbi:MAG TPA: L,D-transpeptidase family protein [Gammaproteobacteria bacterium]|nr:L,D-transpeptidase family protein [Gammaproteobacteria bacterium]
MTRSYSPRLLFGLILISFAWTAPLAAAETRRSQSQFAQYLERQLPPAGEQSTADTEAAAVRRFYALRDNEPAWITADGGALSAAGPALAALAAAAAHGLDPATYDSEDLAARVNRFTGEASEAQALELALSRALIALAFDLVQGRVGPASVGSWHTRPRTIGPDGVDVAARLAEGVVAGRLEPALAALAPQHPEYAALRQARVRYLDIVEHGGWTEVPAGPTLRPGEPGLPARLAALERRLRQEGFLAPADSAILPAAAPTTFGRVLAGDRAVTGEALYGPPLVAAVREFQRLRGITVDGILGPQTVRTLNVPARTRLAQIDYNLERWRWLSADTGGRHIRVNVAAFDMALYQNDVPQLRSAVVVGKESWKTDIFSDVLERIIVNPYWNVPRSILEQDILPKAKADPDYLREKNLEIVDGWGNDAPVVDPRRIDWQRLDVDAFPYRLRQRPGPENSLGLVKFRFPNDFNIYLHDTPADQLFSRTDRAFSHGCIRVERPVALAAQVLAHSNPGLDEDTIRQAIAAGERREFVLEAPVPVFILYWTALVNAEGELEFHQDIYDIDGKLAQALSALDARPA